MIAAPSHDGNGNRLTRTVGGSTESYSYDDEEKLQSVSVGGVSVKTYGYDAAGRTTSVVSSSGTTTLAYDAEGRAVTISGPGVSQTNSYNGLDTRASSVTNSVTNTFLRDGAYVTDPVVKDSNATYTPGISERRSGTTKHLSHNLKSEDTQTTTSQSVAASRVYDAFGNITSSTETFVGPFGYGGGFGCQEEATGLKLLGHRMYDSSTGRILTRDPIKDGRNWYVYCESDPVGSFDNQGHKPEKIGAAAGAGLGIGILTTPGYTDGHGQFVIGNVTPGRNGRPFVKDRVFHIDYPHGKPGYRSNRVHINSDVMKGIDHAQFPDALKGLGSARVLKGGGIAILVVVTALDVNQIANSPDPASEAAKIAAIAGAAAVGAAIGASVLPGIGTTIGSVAFSAVTVAIVYWDE